MPKHKEHREKERERDTEMDHEVAPRDPVRFWGSILGASALGLAILTGVVVQLRAPQPETARMQAAVRTPATTRATAKPSKPEAAKPHVVKPEVAKAEAAKPEVAKPEVQPAAKAVVAKAVVANAEAPAKTQSAPRALSVEERKTSEALWVEQRKLDAGARAVAKKPEGERRVVAAIARQLRVPEKVVHDLRARKVAYGELTVTLALAQQLVKRDKLKHAAAVDDLLGRRKTGQGWAAIARDLDLTLTTVLAEVKKADQQLARLDTDTPKTRKG